MGLNMYPLYITHVINMCICVIQCVLVFLRYFDEVFNASGGPDLVKKYGSWFSFNDNPRAQMFRRNQSLVTDLESMVHLMRYKPALTSNYV